MATPEKASRLRESASLINCFSSLMAGCPFGCHRPPFIARKAVGGRQMLFFRGIPFFTCPVVQFGCAFHPTPGTLFSIQNILTLSGAETTHIRNSRKRRYRSLSSYWTDSEGKNTNIRLSKFKIRRTRKTRYYQAKPIVFGLPYGL